MLGLSILTWIKIGLCAVIIGAVGGAGWEVYHSIQQAAIRPIVAADKLAAADRQLVATTMAAKTAQVDVEAGDTATTHQATLAAQAAVVKQKRSTHVVVPPAPPTAPGCVTFGLVRQHDAAALGVDPDSLPLPAGATDGACSPVTDADLADAIGDNYAAARANAQELTDLQARDTHQVDATKPKS